MTSRTLLRLSVILIAVGAGSARTPSVAAESADVNAPLPAMKTQVAFESLKFERPVAMAWPSDESNLLFVIEQVGRIVSFPNDRATNDVRLFLDLSGPKVNRAGNEEGMLGLAFHPNYAENGEFFVYYSAVDPKNDAAGRRSVVSRFRVSADDPRRADPNSEEIIWISEKDPFSNHNGGCIEFGPDGFLYISLGDGGAADDPLNTGQNPSDWFGSILRIDVDNPSEGRAYGIPPSNPRLRDPERFARWAPEVYAIGLRNVWKFTFDRETGQMWGGDVGQNLWEEIDIIENGGNYGWSRREAFHPFPKGLRRRARNRADAASPISEPIAEYPHKLNQRPTAERTDIGLSVTGGYVYRGTQYPELQGVYVYGDYNLGRIWGVREQDGQATVSGELIDLKRSGQPALQIAAFGEDRSGELFILAFDGRIHELVPADQ